jgi:hypothetical protein
VVGLGKTESAVSIWVCPLDWSIGSVATLKFLLEFKYMELLQKSLILDEDTCGK